MSKNKDTLTAFLDVSGAFDNVNTDILLTKLAKIGCSTSMVKFIKFITHERLIHTDISSDTARSTFKGVPQGGVLSPLLYIIYVADIVKNLPKNVVISQFADDIAIYTKVRSLNKSIKILETAITTIKNNLSGLGLSLSPQKTVLLHFNNKGILPNETSIKIDDHVIKSSGTAKFLGITFDYKMSFAPQIENVRKKCFKSLNIIKFLRGTWWGCDPETLTVIYKSFVRSIIDYGCFVYFPNRKEMILKLERIQFASIRYALGYRISTPTNILIAESKLPLIEERTKLLCNNYLSKALTNSSSQVYNIISKPCFRNRTGKKRNILIQKCIREIQWLKKRVSTKSQYNIYHYDYFTTTTSIPFNTELGKMLQPSKNANSMFNRILEDREGDIVDIFTDGSKILESESVGFACYCQRLNISICKNLNSHASVFTAECLALREALDIALQNPGNNFFIFSDSLSALQALENPKIDIKTTEYILDIKQKYNELIKNQSTTIKLFWIPSHKGIEGNEKADSLAKEATTLQTTSHLPIPFADFYESFKNTAKQNCCARISEQGLTKGKYYFEHYFTNKPKPWYADKQLPREFITWVNRCRADHYHLASSLTRKNFILDPRCKCGFENEDLNHVIWQCILYEEHRKKLLRKLLMLKHQSPYCIKVFLHQPNVKILLHVHAFLKSCNVSI